MFRWKGIIAIIVLLVCAAVFNTFFIDAVVRAGFSAAAGLVTNTIAGIKKADVSMRALNIQAGDFFLVDPDDVTTSIVTADRFEFGLSPAPLLSKKVHIKTVALEGLKWNQPRSAEDIKKDRARLVEEKAEDKEKSTEQKADEKTDEKKVSSIGPLIDRLSERVTVKKEDLASVALMNSLSQRIQVSRTENEKKLETLNVGPRLSEAEKTIQQCEYIKKLGKKDFKDKKKVKQAKKDLEELKKSVKDLKKLDKELSGVSGNMKKNIQKIREDASRLPEKKKKDIEHVQETYKLDSIPEAEVAQILFGESAGNMTETYLPYVKKAAKLFPPKDKKSKARKRSKKTTGNVVEFSKGDELPGLLIENISFSGEKNGISVQGTVQGITSNPKLYGKPLKIQFSSSKPAFTVDAVLDRTGNDPKDTYDIRIEGLDPGRFLKPKAPVFPFTFAKGSLSVNAHIERTDSIYYSVSCIITQSALSGKASSHLSRIIKKAVEQTPEITFEFAHEPEKGLSFNSNLDSVLNKAVKDEIRNMAEKRKKEAEEQINKLAAQAQESFESTIREQEGKLRAKLDSEEASLKKTRKQAEEIQKKFEKKKKKAEKELKDNLKDLLKK